MSTVVDNLVTLLRPTGRRSLQNASYSVILNIVNYFLDVQNHDTSKRMKNISFHRQGDNYIGNSTLGYHNSKENVYKSFITTGTCM